MFIYVDRLMMIKDFLIGAFYINSIVNVLLSLFFSYIHIIIVCKVF